ncbi:MAG: hypothetical protein LBC61_05500 [Candidatus Peribacteria bacterium]|nr:hypothetical protein [Candidatus Peribacteria bacterium]
MYNSTGKVTVQATKDDEENDENHRILIGISNKNTIYPTPLPLSISKGNSDKGDSEAVKFYQVAVLLHEFFHTFESNFRNSTSGDRGKIELIDSN